MKKLAKVGEDHELKSEYRFDYSKAKANRFAGRLGVQPVVVLLEPDVAEVFQDSAAVNAVLRSIVKALPPESLRIGHPAK